MILKKNTETAGFPETPRFLSKNVVMGYVEMWRIDFRLVIFF